MRLKRMLAAGFGAIVQPLSAVFLLPWAMLYFTISMFVLFVQHIYEAGADLRQKRKSWFVIFLGGLSVAIASSPIFLGIVLPLGFAVIPIICAIISLYAIYLGALLGYQQGFKGVINNSFIPHAITFLYKELFGRREEAEQVRQVEGYMQTLLQRRGRTPAEIERALSGWRQLDDQSRLTAANRILDRMRALRADDSQSSNQLLAGKIQSLKRVEQKILFLNEDEIKRVEQITNQDHPAKRALASYQILLKENECGVSLSEMNEINHPVTIEFQLVSTDKIFRRVFEEEKLIEWLNKIPAHRLFCMPDSPDKLLDGTQLNGNEDGTCLTGNNAKPSMADAKQPQQESYQVKIYKGFPSEIVKELQTYIEMMRNLNATNQHAFYHHPNNASPEKIYTARTSKSEARRYPSPVLSQ